MVPKLSLISALVVGVGLFSVSADAKPKKKSKSSEAKEFARRFGSLQKNKTGLFVIKMSADDDPTQLPAKLMGSGPVLVSGERMGIYTPPLITTDDIVSVVNTNMVDVRRCYKQQLEKDPEWSDHLILDLAIKKTGRVGEVSVAPGRVKKDIIGQCLISTVPKWKFPEFTGETDDGITQEVVNASFPFSFSTD